MECADLALENVLPGPLVSSAKDFLPGGAVALSSRSAHTSKGLSDIQLSPVYLKSKQENKQVICIEEGSYKNPTKQTKNPHTYEQYYEFC